MEFNDLVVTAVHKPIKEAITVTFELPTALQTASSYQYYAGQHLILKLHIDGTEFRRCYSLNSCPYSDASLQITIKRVKGGVVSNYLNDQLQVGDKVSVSTPQGRFFANINANAYKSYFLFAAGSGITPIISILKSVLETSKDALVYLFYGNTDQDSIIFKEELDEIAQNYPDQVGIVYTLSAPKVWTTWETWKGKKGRIDASSVEWFINQHPPIAQQTEYYSCGPGAMNTTVKNTLLELGIPKELIHIEQFGATEELSNEMEGVDKAQLTVSLDRQSHQLKMTKGKTILETLKAAEVASPYSCESGVCGTCVATLVKGEVVMKSCMALDDEELKKGLILTCRALPKTEEIEVKFER